MNASKWKRVYTGGGCSFAIDDCSRLSAWGKNSSYELGLGDNINRYVPEQVGNGRWLMISSAQGYGFNTTFGLDANHRIFAWGRSGYNTCRFCDIEDMPVESEGSSEFKTPTYLALSNIENSQWQEIAATSSNTIYARKASGELWAWGKGGYYGDEKESSCEPRRINIIDIDLILAAGNARFAFSAGRLFVWGGNQYSLLGLGISESYSISYSAPVGAD
jgi:alpha-tubulin suppressor-like RCC1 family protein